LIVCNLPESVLEPSQFSDKDFIALTQNTDSPQKKALIHLLRKSSNIFLLDPHMSTIIDQICNTRPTQAGNIHLYTHDIIDY
jgi:hypothetical protein